MSESAYKHLDKSYDQSSNSTRSLAGVLKNDVQGMRSFEPDTLGGNKFQSSWYLLPVGLKHKSNNTTSHSSFITQINGLEGKYKAQKNPNTINTEIPLS